MTRRERLENKLERREEWAAKASYRSEAAANTAHGLTCDIPLGQPNINGALTSVLNRAGAAMSRSCAESAKAEYHEQKAEGLSRMLGRTIFSDDPDAVEQIEKKIAELEYAQEHYKNINKICKSKKLDEVAKINQLQGIGVTSTMAQWYAEIGRVPSCVLTNNNANIRRYKQRLAGVKIRQGRTAAAESAENGIIILDVGYDIVTITFAEKPEYCIIQDLKQAGFYWRGGSWRGRKADIPESVKQEAGAK